jgi:NhaP-type Na+/H+ or K+/H+ antiporter
MLRGHRRGE